MPGGTCNRNRPSISVCTFATSRPELLKTAINIDHVNRLGWTALLEAILLGDGGAAHSDIVRLLVARGANVNLADGQGITPLAHAEQRGQSVIIEVLRRAGARR